MESTSTSPGMKRNSNDVGWDYGYLCDSKNPDRVKCKLCAKEMGGGVYRIKEHIAHRKGNVSPCPVSTKDDQSKCMKAIFEAKNKKRKVKTEADALSFDVNVVNGRQNMVEDGFVGNQGPMDKFLVAEEDSSGQENTNDDDDDMVYEEIMVEARQSCARWVYQYGIPFDAIDNDSFRSFCEALGQLGGHGWVPPKECELRGTLLKGEEEIVKDKLKSLEVEREKYGCSISILVDSWTDDAEKNIMTLCVNSKGGTGFLSSEETSKESQTGAFIFEHVDKCIEDVGSEKIVQVVTVSAENNLAAAKMLKEKRPSIFWSACAAQTVNLMLEDIVKLPKISTSIDKAKAVTMFIYSHEKTLAMMRDYTKEKDIVRPGVTKFATTFLTMQNLLEKKAQIKSMFISNKWERCKDSKYVKGRSSYYTCLSPAFWNGISRVVNVLEPLVKVLRMVEGEKKPSMGFIYGELIEAKRSIKIASNDLESYYQPIIEIIDKKIKGKLDSPLHLTAYLLNPFYFYNEQTVHLDETLKNGFANCVETLYYGELEKQDKIINHEFKVYQDKLGLFGIPFALRGCKKKSTDEFDPRVWWSSYGCSARNLEILATKILSLTSSSSNFQQNWSVFEESHKSEKKRLDVDQMKSLVYVQSNLRLFNKQKRIKEENCDVLVGENEANVEEWFMELDQEREEEGEDEIIDDQDDESAFHFEFESEDES